MCRLAAEGGVLGYIHPGSRLGVLLEVNCETDFVARSEPFLALVNTLAMQIAASPSMEYVTADEIPADVFEAEQAIEMGREDLQSKPEAIRAKIAEGRVKKLVQVRMEGVMWGDDEELQRVQNVDGQGGLSGVDEAMFQLLCYLCWNCSPGL